VSELGGCLRGVAAFAAVLLAPGYLLGWAVDLFEFRGWALRERLAWSVALSFAVTPLAAAMLGKYVTLNAVCGVAGLCGLGWLGLIARDPWARRVGMRWHPRRGWVWGPGIAAAWAVFCFAELADIGVGSKLFLSVTIYDHALRTSFVDAVLRTGVPPANPLYWPGHTGWAPMRYYYFWYVLTAAAARLGQTTARQALIASVVWAGFGLAALVDLYCRYFLGDPLSQESVLSTGGGVSAAAAERPATVPPPKMVAGRTLLALALLAVTGLDVIPAIVKALARMPADADMEWWSQAQVASWMDSVLWVPHHVAGLVACLLGFLLVWKSKQQHGAGRWGCAGIAGVGFASAFGLSTWVAVTFAMVMVVWLVWGLGWEQHSRERLPVLIAAGAVAVLLLQPYIRELRSEVSGAETVAAHGADAAADAGRLLRFGVRHIIDPGVLSAVPGFARLAQTHPRLEDALAGLVLLLPGYIAELGFYGVIVVAALWAGRRRHLDEAERTALLLTLATLGLATFLRSAVVANNDFGTRSMLVAQFFLLLLAVRWFEGGLGGFGAQASAKRLCFAMLAMLWIGVAGTAYQAVLLRVYLPVEERLGNPELAGFAERAMAWHMGFAEMDRRIPKDAVIQFNTAQPNDFFNYVQILFAGRQMANALPVCAAAFGGDPANCGGLMQGIAVLYQPGLDRVPDRMAGVVECERFMLDDLVATRWDAIWADHTSWVWGLPAVVDTGDVRVLECGRGSLSPPR
jgi:hypothetical protein